MTDLDAPRPRAVLRRVVLWTLAIVAMLGAFVAYLDPHLMVALGDAVWSCF
jgi:hypothetical protein